MQFDIDKYAKEQNRSSIDSIEGKFNKKSNSKELGFNGTETYDEYNGDENQIASDIVSNQLTPWSSSFQGGAQYDTEGNPYHSSQKENSINFESVFPIVTLTLLIFLFVKYFIKK